MKPRQQVSRAALELIKTFEGYRQKAAQLPDGRWTIGYGHTRTAREGAEVSREDAEALLLYDLIGVSHALNEHVYAPLTQNQFDALASFALNVGIDNFRGSIVLRRVNEGQSLQAAYALEMWRRADFEGERIIIDALVRRRSAEKTLFLTPAEGWTPAPTPVLPPKLDFEIEPFAPREAATAVRAALDGPLAFAERETTDGQATAPAPAAAPTATEEAAAGLVARLEAIATEEPAPTLAESWTPPVIAAPDAGAEIKPFRAPGPPSFAPPPLDLSPPPPPQDGEPSPQPSPETLVRGAPETSPQAAVQPVATAEPQPSAAARPDIVDGFDPALSLDKAKPFGAEGLGLSALAVGGLVVFAGGVFWGLNAAPDPTGGVSFARTLGWLLGVLGVVCFGVAAYGLLRKLGGDEAED